MGYGTDYSKSLAWRRYLDEGWCAWALPLHDDKTLLYTFVLIADRDDEWIPAMLAILAEIRRRPSLAVDRMPS